MINLEFSVKEALQLQRTLNHYIREDSLEFPSQLVKNLREIISSSESLTKNNNKFLFYFCVNYGGRQEIVKVAKELAVKSSAGEIKPSEINEELFN